MTATLVAKNGRLLARLVEDLLDVSRVAAGQFEIVRRLAASSRASGVAADSFISQPRLIRTSMACLPSFRGARPARPREPRPSPIFTRERR